MCFNTGLEGFDLSKMVKSWFICNNVCRELSILCVVLVSSPGFPGLYFDKKEK